MKQKKLLRRMQQYNEFNNDLIKNGYCICEFWK